MAVDEKKLEAAKAAYTTLCRFLDGDNWRYQKDEENFIVTITVQGDDLPIEAVIKIDPEKEIVKFLSRVPCKVPEDKRLDLAVAVAVANNGLLEGSFDYSITDERIHFCFVNIYRGCVLGESAFAHIVLRGFKYIDKYNEMFLLLSKGLITIEQFLKSENGEGGESNG